MLLIISANADLAALLTLFSRSQQCCLLYNQNIVQDVFHPLITKQWHLTDQDIGVFALYSKEKLYPFVRQMDSIRQKKLEISGHNSFCLLSTTSIAHIQSLQHCKI